MNANQFNEMCAEFLGAIRVYTDHTEGNEDYCKAEGIDKWIIETWTTPTSMKHLESVYGWGCFRFTSSMKYHSDWNWLMCVVEAIEKIKEVRDVQISSTGCVIFHKDRPFSSHMPEKQKAVVEAVYNFLTWLKRYK